MGPVWSAPRGRRPATDHVVVLGVPEAGRKTLAGYFLLNGAALRPAEPVIAGMQVLTGQRALPTGRVMRVTTWSVGGSDRVKPLWPVWADGATRVVFAVDAAGGPDRMTLARDELADLGVMPNLPLVVVATKAQYVAARTFGDESRRRCGTWIFRGDGSRRWIFRGDGSRRRRGRDVDIPQRSLSRAGPPERGRGWRGSGSVQRGISRVGCGWGRRRAGRRMPAVGAAVVCDAAGEGMASRVLQAVAGS